MSTLKLYLIFTLLPHINTAMYFIFSAGVVAIIGSVNTDVPEHTERIIWRIFSIGIIMIFISSIWLVFSPSRNQLLTIYGIHSITKINGADKIPSNLINFINKEVEVHKGE